MPLDKRDERTALQAASLGGGDEARERAGVQAVERVAAVVELLGGRVRGQHVVPVAVLARHARALVDGVLGVRHLQQRVVQVQRVVRVRTGASGHDDGWELGASGFERRL
jgi:hypothetical protein